MGGLGSLTDKQIQLLNSLDKRGSMDSLKHLVKDVELDFFQTRAVMECILTKGTIVSLDTGLGKTLVAIALMNYWKAVLPAFKTIYICERSNFEKTIEKIRNHSDLKVKGTTAEGNKLNKITFKTELSDFDVLVVTYQGLRDYELNKWLFDLKHLFGNIVIDESHTIGNDTSFTYQVVRGICNQIENKCLLTATPLRTDPRQFINQYEMIDRDAFEDKDDYARRFEIRNEQGKVTQWKDLDTLAQNLKYRYVSYTREELDMRGNYDVQVELVRPRAEHATADRTNMNSIIKGDPKGNAIKRTIERLEQFKDEGKKGLVYCNTNENKKMLLDRILQSGLRVNIIDGSLSNPKYRTQTQDAFNRGEYDVIITNITTALDMQCDFILFYEMTVDSKQMIGRGERGLKGNDLELVYVLTRNTVEIDYFIENVYNRAVLLKAIAGKDMSEIEEVRRRL